MTPTKNFAENTLHPNGRRSTKSHRKKKALFVRILVALLVSAATLGLATVWLGMKATTIKDELYAARELITPLRSAISTENGGEAALTVDRLREHTDKAKSAANDPIWTLATSLPGVGQNFSAVAEIARSADDVANLGLKPLIRVYNSLDWQQLIPTSSGADLEPLKRAAPSVSSAAHAVRVSEERLRQIDANNLLPQVAEPLIDARHQLQEVTGTLDLTADVAQIAPKLLGSDGPRDYLLMIQNNAETRSSGGIPGALAVLTVDHGKMTLGRQSSAGEVGVMTPPVTVDPTQQAVYTGRLGKFMQDVNLTPDFPTAAETAQAMWERHTGQRVDGVISIDPIALGYILDATGPVDLTRPELVSLGKGGLPIRLSGRNVVQTLLSDVYTKIAEPKLQDVYFAGVAQEIFSALASGKGSAPDVIKGVTRAASEGRILLWSSLPDEQAQLANYSISGSISGPSVAPAQFGVYFNDGTGAKMDFYVRRTVQLIRECPKDGYEQATVRITSTNTAPADAATALPKYVTGGGAFGVTPGAVQTNIVAYGPIQALAETARVDGSRTDFAPYVHSNRPVGVLAIRLAPGETKSVEFTFGKIVQHTDPTVVVTPTVQPVNDVTLPTENAPCS